MSENWIKVYDLKLDKETVSLVQNATLNTKGFGLVPEIALFGSEEWWDAIEQGLIPLHRIEGIISDLYMTGHGDWPEMEIESKGQKTRWTRLGTQNFYKKGNQIKLEYVIQKAKKIWLDSQEQKEVLRIFIMLE